MRTLKRLVLFLFVVVIGFITWFFYHINTDLKLPFIPYEISIKPGSSLKNIAQQFADAKILPNEWSFILLTRLMNHESAIKAGDYILDRPISQIELLDYLIKGDAKQNEIQFIEGWTFSQLRQVLNAHPAIRHDTVNLSDQEILKVIGASETVPEGLFFPDTYYFVKYSSDTEILRRAYVRMQHQLANVWSNRDESIPLETKYDALVLASIVEKETGLESDRAEIAGVFINRLRLGMRLQTDPTVIYGIGETFDGNLRKRDLQTDHAYNTYTRAGLPPTPIAMPGLRSLYAAVNPAKTDALYFVAKGNGESVFSTNLADHNRAVAKYQKKQTQ
jgi:UPF0755 protein